MPPSVAIPSDGETDGTVKTLVPDTSAITFADPEIGGPSVLFFMGANGMGKTTTVGKVASRLREEGGQKVLLAAADTFRCDVNTTINTVAKRGECNIYRTSALTGIILANVLGIIFGTVLGVIL